MWLVVRQGVLRAALLPLYARWWRRHVGGRLFLALLAAYLAYAGLVMLHCAADVTAASVQVRGGRGAAACISVCRLRSHMVSVIGRWFIACHCMHLY